MMRTILFILFVAFLLLLHEGTISGYRFLNVVHAADKDFNTSSQRGMTQLSTDGEKRHALLIGMSEYEGVYRLKNPVNDIMAMKSLLETQGKGMWEVEILLNKSGKDVVNKVKDFTMKYKGKILLFFYTGHAVQVEGESYLIPIDQKVTDTTVDIKHEAVNANYILNKFLEAQSKLSIIILDSCRSNNFLGTRGVDTRGMAPLRSTNENGDKDYYIIYATRPGQVAMDDCGYNSCFTKHLLRGLKNNGNKPLHSVINAIVGDVWRETKQRQKPEFTNSSEIIEFYMFEGLGGTSPPLLPDPPVPQPSICEKLKAKVVAGRVLSTEEQQFFNTCGKK